MSIIEKLRDRVAKYTLETERKCRDYADTWTAAIDHILDDPEKEIDIVKIGGYSRCTITIVSEREIKHLDNDTLQLIARYMCEKINCRNLTISICDSPYICRVSFTIELLEEG